MMGAARTYRRAWRRLRHAARLAFYFGVIAVGALVFGFMLEVQPNGWSVVAVIACYGIWAVTEALEKRQAPLTIIHLTADTLEASGSFHLSKPDLDAAVERLLRAESEQKS
jgi:hypothetical protein